MFNKSILAAALLTVGAIAGGSAVSAAEIGVRNTTGFSTRNIYGGQSSYVREVNGSYTEDSAGTALRISANGYSVRDVTRSSGGESTGTFDGHFTGGYGGGLQYGNMAGSIELTEAPSSSSTETVKDGDFRRVSSDFTRNESGSIREVSRESFNFGGTSSSSFSELSTFSR